MGALAAGVLVSAAKFVRQERVQAFAGGCSRGAGKRASNLRHRLVVENAGEARAPPLGQQLNREAVQLSTSATSLEGEVLTTSQWSAVASGTPRWYHLLGRQAKK